MLTQASSFCLPFGLHFSPAKSNIVVFHRPRAKVAAFTCMVEGVPVPVVDNVVFLGIAFHATQGHAFGLKQRAMFAKRAAAKVEGIMQSIHVSGFLHATLYLSRFIVRPALSYGAELFALGQVRPSKPIATISLAEREYVKHLRWALQVGPCTSRHVVYRECGEHPLQRDWLIAACRLHNRLIAHPSVLLQTTMQAAVAATPTQWGQELRAALDGCSLAHVSLAHAIPMAIVATAFDAAYACAWHSLVSDPRDVNCLHRQISSYSAWCDTPDLSPSMPSYMMHSLADSSQRMIAQVRCGCSGRVPAHHDWHCHTPYPERLCTACGAAPGDLLHILLQCTHPYLRSLRLQFALPAHVSLPEMFWDEHLTPRAYACLNTIMHVYPIG